MKSISLVEKLRIASEDPTAISRAELTALLRRAALRIDNTSTALEFEPIWEAALMSVAAELEMTREQAITALVREWLISNAYLPAHMLDEDGEVAGNA